MAPKQHSGEQTASETYELLEKAQQRIKQKKRLYYHFVLFLIGSIFLIIVNKILKVKEEWDWFVWAVTLWSFLLVLHTFNVFVTHKFLGKAWEQKQREKLIAKQQHRIAEIEQEVKAALPDPQQKDIPPQ
ncbi:MAG: 2TM domain-containing protein [Bacteroidota bacterium]